MEVPTVRPLRICITLYAYGDLRADVFPCHMDLIASICTERRQVQWFTIREDALISRSRCRATQQFLASGADVWLQLDHDISWTEPADLWRLCDLAATHDAAIQIPYAKRGNPPAPSHRPHPDHPLPAPGTDALTPILMAASGCLAITRTALLRTLDLCRTDAVPPYARIHDAYDSYLGAPMPTLWHPIVIPVTIPGQTPADSFEYLSEDYSASVRLALASVPLLAWTRPTLKHWGMYGYSLATDPAATTTTTNNAFHDSSSPGPTNAAIP